MQAGELQRLMTDRYLMERRLAAVAALNPLPPRGGAGAEDGGPAPPPPPGLGIVGDVELGLATLDGALQGHLTAVAVSLCGHTTGVGLAGYSRLQRLRIIVEGGEGCELEPAVSDRFNAAVVPELAQAALPALRELHIGRPPRFAPLFPHLYRIQLPLLQRLVLNEGVSGALLCCARVL